jgi:hypothetical protein
MDESGSQSGDSGRCLATASHDSGRYNPQSAQKRIAA